MPALHIETTMQEISKNTTRMVVCTWIPSVSSGSSSGARFRGVKIFAIVYEHPGQARDLLPCKLRANLFDRDRNRSHSKQCHWGTAAVLNAFDLLAQPPIDRGSSQD
jgi:hypothetical protein